MKLENIKWMAKINIDKMMHKYRDSKLMRCKHLKIFLGGIGYVYYYCRHPDAPSRAPKTEDCEKCPYFEEGEHEFRATE